MTMKYIDKINQKDWEWEAARHARAVEALKSATSPGAIEYWKRAKQAAELKYPILSKPFA